MTPTTTERPAPEGGPDLQPKRAGGTGTLTPAVRYSVLALSAIVGSLLVTLVWGWNIVGAIILSAIVYIAAIYLVSRTVEGSRHATDRMVTGIVTTMFLFALIPLVSVVWTVVSSGLDRFDVEFFTYSMIDDSTGGGAYHAIMGTLIITGLTTLISVPIGIFAAIYLVEYGNKNLLSRGLTFFVDVMTGIPSIVAGLFSIALFMAVFDDKGIRMGIIGAVALSVLMIPVVVRSTEEMLQLVPNELREASYALGVPKWLTIVKIVLPTAIAGIATGVTLAIARVIGETAPLLVTVGTIYKTNLNPFDGRMETLPIFAYYSYATPGLDREAAFDRMWAAALTLMLIVMALNLIARLISKFFAPKTGR